MPFEAIIPAVPRFPAAGRLLAGAAFFLLSPSLAAATVINVPGDQPTIQDAFDAASLAPR